MRSNMGITIRDEDSTEHRMECSPHLAPWAIDNVKLVRKSPEHVQEIFKFCASDEQGLLAPGKEGLLVIDLKNNKILDGGNSYSPVGGVSVVSLSNIVDHAEDLSAKEFDDIRLSLDSVSMLSDYVKKHPKVDDYSFDDEKVSGKEFVARSLKALKNQFKARFEEYCKLDDVDSMSLIQLTKFLRQIEEKHKLNTFITLLSEVNDEGWAHRLRQFHEEGKIEDFSYWDSRRKEFVGLSIDVNSMSLEDLGEFVVYGKPAKAKEFMRSDVPAAVEPTAKKIEHGRFTFDLSPFELLSFSESGEGLRQFRRAVRDLGFELTNEEESVWEQAIGSAKAR